MKRAVFLDRDGTIIEDTYYLNDPNKIKILPTVIKGLKKLQDFGFIPVIVSNQSGVGRGYFKESIVKSVNKRLEEKLKCSGIIISGNVYSPYYKESKLIKYRKNGHLRKPEPGMLVQAAGSLDIELTASYMIGDKESDIGAGINAGTKKNVFVKGKYKYEGKKYLADKEAKDFNEAVDWIIKQELGSKIIPNKEYLLKLVQDLRVKKKRIATTNGAFDILHIGHIRFLNECKKNNDVLIVGLNSNRSIKEYKSRNRPIINQFARAEMLVNLKPVDYVYIFDEPDPRAFLKIVKTNVHYKAVDYDMSRIIEKEVVESFGGLVKLIQFIPGYSTTAIINKIKNYG